MKREREREATDVLIVGAGPCGLAAAIAVQRAGLRSRVIERGCLVSGLASYPTYMSFFSTAPKLEIGGIPFVVATEKPTRRDALAYYRAVTEHFDLDVRQYEHVESIERGFDGSRFIAHSVSRGGDHRSTEADAIVIATGYFGSPNRLGVHGEDLPHVTHRYRDGHEAFRQDAVVVGGGNSAVEAVLDLQRSGARVTLVHFGPTFDRNIKPWILPTIEARMASGEIAVRWNSRVTRIDPDAVVIVHEGEEERVPAGHVYLMIGYMPEVTLLRQLGVPIDPETGVPRHDPATMETPVTGVFIAGVIASGYDANKTFIENGRFHGDLIARRLVAAGAPDPNPSPS